MGTQVYPTFTDISRVSYNLATETSDHNQSKTLNSNNLNTNKGIAPEYGWSDILERTSTWISTMSLLEWAAETGNENSFLEIAASFKWENIDAASAIHVVKLALRAGAHFYARDFSSRASKRYPYSVELKRLAAVLAPPRIVHRTPAQESSMALNRCWLHDHKEEYRFLWVALQRGQLLASAVTLQDMKQALPKSFVPCPDILITRVD